MSVHSQDSDNEELGAIGGNKTTSHQVSPFSRPSSVVIMESLARTLTEQNKEREQMQRQQDLMQQQQRELIQSVNTIKDQSETTNSTLTDMSARLERLERASPDLN